MTVLGLDTFTDTGGTAITSHSPDTGTSWSTGANEFGTAAAVIATAGTYVVAAGPSYAGHGGGVLNLASYPSADYNVKATCIWHNGTDETLQIQGRIQSATSYYVAMWRTFSSLRRIDLFQVYSAGGYNPLGTPYSYTETADLSVELELRMAGTSISVWKDGSSVISVTDSSISAAGQAGFYLSGLQANGGTDSFRIDRFEVNDGASSGSSIAAISSGYHQRGLR